MGLKRKNFTFDIEWSDILGDLTAEVRLEVYDAIVEYAKSGTLSDLKPMAKVVFSIIKKQMDSEFARQDEISEKRAEAGRKAMMSRYGKTDDNKCKQELTNVTSVSKCKQVLANDSNCSNNIINNIYNNQDNINKKETTTKVVEKKKEKSAAKAAPTSIELRKKAFYDSLIPFLDKYPKDMIRAFFDYWSEMNKSGTKMRYELERTWEVSKRLATWASRDNGFKRPSMEIGTVLHDNSTEKYQNEEKWNR